MKVLFFIYKDDSTTTLLLLYMFPNIGMDYMYASIFSHPTYPGTGDYSMAEWQHSAASD